MFTIVYPFIAGWFISWKTHEQDGGSTLSHVWEATSSNTRIPKQPLGQPSFSGWTISLQPTITLIPECLLILHYTSYIEILF
jgi:hypothetical protein